MARGAAMVVMAVAGALVPESGWAEAALRLKVKDGCRWIVQVKINGQGDHGFLVDTGATTTVVDAKLAAKLGIEPKGSARAGTYAGKVDVPLARFDSLTVGPHSHVGLEVIVMDLEKFFALDGSIHGILGQDVLSRFNYRMDHRARTLVIEEEGDAEPGPAETRLPFERRGGIPFVEVTVPAIPAVTLRVALDSGIPYPVLYADSASRLGLQAAPRAAAGLAAQSGLGRRELLPRLLERLNVGILELKGLTVYVTPRREGERREDGILPLGLFDSVYVNNTDSFMVFSTRPPR